MSIPLVIREPRFAICFAVAMVSHVACLQVASAQVAPANDAKPNPALLLASRYDGSASASERALLGKPVVVSRFDSEASTSRVRSVEILKDSAEFVQPAPSADPAFRAVFLTPRGSTGRPVPIQMTAYAKADEAVSKIEEPQAKPAEATSPPEAAKPAEPAANSRALISQEKVAPKPHLSARPTPQGERAEARRPRPELKAAPRAQVARAERSSYGPAEIAATRAFTRF